MHLGVFEITHDLLVRDRAGFLFCFLLRPLSNQVFENRRELKKLRETKTFPLTEMSLLR